MKLVLLYGPPGVGKLTVAKELSKLTGFALLHNHLFNDLIREVFDFGTPEFLEAVREYRFDLMARAARAGTAGVITTLVYAKGVDDGHLKETIVRMRKVKSEVLFVRLTCQREELFRRVKNPTRAMFRKVKTIKLLNKIMKNRDIISEVPYKPNFALDNTKITPRRAARLIAEHYGLSKAKRKVK